MASRFLNDMAIRTFVNREAVDVAIVGALNENRRLGQHSDVVLLTSGKFWRYIWGSASSRPFGIRNDRFLQCTCGALRSQTIKLSSPAIVLWNCKSCMESITFKPPRTTSRDGWAFTTRQAVSNAPEWFRETATRQYGHQ